MFICRDCLSISHITASSFSDFGFCSPSRVAHNNRILSHLPVRTLFEKVWRLLDPAIGASAVVGAILHRSMDSFLRLRPLSVFYGSYHHHISYDSPFSPLLGYLCNGELGVAGGSQSNGSLSEVCLLKALWAPKTQNQDQDPKRTCRSSAEVIRLEVEVILRGTMTTCGEWCYCL